jgi:hypothetical protein
MITFALNANVQSHDGNSTTYTNEPSNQICYDFINLYPGFKITGTLNITEQSKLVVFLAHPDGRSLIGVVTDLRKDCTSLVESEKDCGCVSGTALSSTFTPLVVDNCCDCSDCYEYSVESVSKSPYIVNYIDCSGLETNITFPAGQVGVFRARKDKYILSSDTSIVSERFISQGICVPKSSKCCLGLSPDYPVYSEYRIDNCNTKVYFIAKNITPRFFSLEEPYGKDQCGVLSDCLSDSCERLKLFPDFCQADIYPTSINSGGALKGGVYSFYR